jgi:hypothetical protein
VVDDAPGFTLNPAKKSFSKEPHMVTLSVLLVLIIVLGVLAIIDGITRFRGKGSSAILAIIEIVLGVLLLLFSLIPGLHNVTYQSLAALALGVVLILLLATFGNGKGRGWASITVIAAILALLVVWKLGGAVLIPGVF